MKALIVIDLQNDFMPYGKLPVERGDSIVERINSLMPNYNLVIATQDWHPKGHCSFSLWGEHCLRGSFGSDFHPQLKTELIDVIFRKGQDLNVDSYSAFSDNEKSKESGIVGLLKSLDISELHFTGLAADVCVYHSMVDALRYGFKVKLHLSATMAISQKALQGQLEELKQNDDFSII